MKFIKYLLFIFNLLFAVSQNYVKFSLYLDLKNAPCLLPCMCASFLIPYVTWLSRCCNPFFSFFRVVNFLSWCSSKHGKKGSRFCLQHGLKSIKLGLTFSGNERKKKVTVDKFLLKTNGRQISICCYGQPCQHIELYLKTCFSYVSWLVSLFFFL